MKTLYHKLRVPLQEGCTALEALQTIARAADGVEDWERYTCATQPTAPCPNKLMMEYNKQLYTALKRDMRLQAVQYDGTLALRTGLIVPLEIVGFAAPCGKDERNLVDIKFIGKGAPHLPMTLKFTAQRTLDRKSVDVMQLLGPALATFLRGRVPAELPSTDALLGLERLSVRPIVPEAMLEAAGSAPFDDHRRVLPAVDIAEAVVGAWRALEATGYYVPRLNDVDLSGKTMDDYLKFAITVAADCAAVQEQIEERIKALVEHVHKEMAEVLVMVNKRRKLLAESFLQF